MRNHTRTVALYCAEQRLAIRCDSIHPAAILTQMWEPQPGQDAMRTAAMAALATDTPLRRFGTPTEVAAVTVLPASDEAGCVTGAEFHVDVGMPAVSAAVAPR